MKWWDNPWMLMLVILIGMGLSGSIDIGAL